MGQVLQGLSHRLHLGNAALQVGDMGQRDALDVGTGAALVQILFNVFIENRI